MANIDQFTSSIETGYTFEGATITLGGAVLDGNPIKGLHIKAPLRMFNRHGLIAGATGTGKTKTLQALAESLAANGVSTLMMDIKGDLSGISQKGTDNPKIQERASKTGIDWTPTQFTTEFLSISKEKGVRMRATISEFGPVLLSKILELNDTQAGLVSMVFKYCDDKGLPLLDIKDFRKTLQYISNEAKKEVEDAYGLVSTSSVGAVMRKLLEIEEQGAEMFFGEKSFDVEDLVRLDENGRGIINILRLSDIQSKPKLFSTFMLCLLAEVYEKFPERGDKENPELVIFIDEAHLIFDEASKALSDQIETIIKLIRSKGVGIFFCTQTPTDVPDAVLSQLGMKIQHALRAFTPKDRDAIKKTSENYPVTDFYKTDELLTNLGIGEALVTVLSEKGIPTPLAHTMMIAPRTRMDVITNDELSANVNASALVKKYNEELDRESAFEMLNAKLQEASAQAEEEKAAVEEEKEEKKAIGGKAEKSTFQKVAESKVTQIVVKEVTRGLLGVLGFKSTTSRRKKTGLFGF
jgi:DNA helicase HerA-like ATPase